MKLVGEAGLGDTDCCLCPQSAHMAMVDALMMAYTVEMISIEKVVASVKRFSTFSASKELPYDLEDAMVFWVNKVNLKMREITEKEVKLKQQLLESPAHQKVRYRREHPSTRQPPHFPLLEDLMRDGRDGAALLAVVHYYCPEQMKLDDICLKEVTSMADSLYNIRLLRDFSSEHLNRCFYLTLEDVLYAPAVLKPNMMAFIAELFWWFENIKPDFVQPRDIQEPKDVTAYFYKIAISTAKTVSHPKSSRPPVPISNATRRSFLGSPAEGPGRRLHPEEAEHPGKGASAFSPPHPLLPLRQRQHKVTQGDDSPGRPVSQPAAFALHRAASWDMDPGSGDTISLARSISKDSLASNVISLTPQNQPHPTALKTNGKTLLNNVDMEDEDEELVAIIRTDVDPHGSDPGLSVITRSPQRVADTLESKPDSFFLEPLMPAVLRPTKEKRAVTKEDECGEGRPRGFASRRPSEGHPPPARTRAPSSHVSHDLNRTFTPISSVELPAGSEPTPTEAGLQAAGEARGEPLDSGGFDLVSQGQSSDGFFLHVVRADEDPEGRFCVSCAHDPEPWMGLRQDSDSDIADLEDAEQELTGEDYPAVITRYAGEEESAKLQEDMKVKEHEDKDDASGRSSPCLSTVSQISSVSMASGSVKMTSFAERKLQRLNSCETKSSTSSSQKTTPDASESCPAPLTTWKQRREQSPSRPSRDHASLLASELLQLHMQLEEKRRAIEAQKKKMEALSARQRLKLGKAAFLHVVKKGKADGPQPLKAEHFAGEYCQHNGQDFNRGVSKTEGFLAKEEGREDLGSPDVDRESLAFVQLHKPRDPAALHELEKSKALSAAFLEDGAGEVVDMSECDLSIEKLNETISTLQQAILKISQQQEQLLMKSPTVPTPGSKNNSQDQKVKASIHFVEPLSPPGMPGHRRPPRLGQGRNCRSGRPAELKVPRDRQQGSSRSKTPTPNAEPLLHLRPFPPQTQPSDPGWDGAVGPGSDPLEKCRLHSYKFHDESDQRTLALSSPKDANILSEQMSSKEGLDSVTEVGHSSPETAGKEDGPMGEPPRNKASLIEVDLSDLRAPDEDREAEGPGSAAELASEGDQKLGVGFFFKDEQKAEDELAKKRAAFLLKQQRKAEEARVRKQQLEAEVELKRDEARRKAEEDRVRKEEEKARRELIKQEYLRRKQRQLLEEQGLGRPRAKPRRPRPKSAHREECGDVGTKSSSTPDHLSRAQSGSSLSLASATTTEPESIPSGGTPSRRVESLEALPILSRNPSRSTDRDWETASAASSLASVAEYTGPKLFKEPSSKSNKPIIHNAISHCCLAGKVNEPHKNSILEASIDSTTEFLCSMKGELEKCDANHYIILFRDAGCQFRALYCYYPDTEDISKLTGTGPKSVTKKMIDRLYKYSSDRKQFNLIPAKTMSVSVDALTIHNHLWQPKRPAVPKKTQTRK
ncbi:hypothetical protein MC885_001085 [Smutsia gigantea]|nr:hypothetical protein MC885_001085 [Smutsia gigantea]